MFAVRQTITSLARASVRGPLVNAAVFANLPASPAGIATRLGAVNWSQSSSYVTKKPRQRLQMQSQPQRRVAIQRPAPFWTAPAVVNGEFKNVSLSDFKGKFLVMVFYPADFTFVCPTELLAFSDRIEEFRALGAEVVGISVDNVHSHLAWTNVPRNQGGLGDIKIPLVSDIRKSISSSYNVLIPDGVALRGLFVIDPNQVVRVAHIHDLPIGRSVDETLRVIEAIKFTDEHGEVCPANWKKGDKTIKPNPTDSKEYFQSVNAQ